MFFAAEREVTGCDAFAPRQMDAAMGAFDHIFRLGRRLLRSPVFDKGIGNEEYDSQQNDLSHRANIAKRPEKGKAATIGTHS
jgi:hypothetical protein